MHFKESDGMMGTGFIWLWMLGKFTGKFDDMRFPSATPLSSRQAIVCGFFMELVYALPVPLW
jgi:hypothetical protein